MNWGSWGQYARGLGYKKTWETRAGGCRMTEYSKVSIGGRLITLQFWADGKHRISHTYKGLMDTAPTYFTTYDGFVEADRIERTRMDNGNVRKSQ